jgi:hypothetical protein
MEGLPDSIRQAKENDFEFLRARPRRSEIDSLVVVRERRHWLVSVDARFQAGVNPMWRAAFSHDSTLSERNSAFGRMAKYYRVNSRPVPEYLTAQAADVANGIVYKDSLLVSGAIVRNPLFRYAPSLGSHQIEGVIRNIGSRRVYLARLIGILATGERKDIYVFDVLPGLPKSFSESSLFADGTVEFQVAEIQFKRD